MDNFRANLNTANETYSSLIEEIEEAIKSAKEVLILNSIKEIIFEDFDEMPEDYFPDADATMYYIHVEDDASIVFYDENDDSYDLDFMSLTDKLVGLEALEVCLNQLVN